MGSDIAGKISGRAASSAKYRMIMVCLVILLIGIFFLSLTVGRYSIPFCDSIAILLARVFPIEPAWTQTMEAVIFNLRLPRTIAAVLPFPGPHIRACSKTLSFLLIFWVFRQVHVSAPRWPYFTVWGR